ncbi:MAG: leucine-rich repeat domain-containing protein [Ruminococcus sp.]|nr:leucine-rich repeat domain-containing protein [Ruminococcus sp.]
MKKIISSVLALSMILGASAYLPAGFSEAGGITAQAEDMLTYGDFKYKLLDDGTAEITAYTGSVKELTVPAKLGSIKVRGFNGLSMLGADDSEKDRLAKIKKVTFSEGIEYLGMFAFYGNDAIEEVVMPDSITSVGHDDEHGDSNLFNGCVSLKKVTLSNGLTSLPMNTFSGCTSLESVKLPDSIKVLDQWVFKYCSALKEVTLPAKLESIGWECFLGCSKLKSIVIPKSVKSISPEAFGYGYTVDAGYVKYDNTVICGHSGTAAEQYAKNNSITFKAITALKSANVTLAKTLYTYTGKAIKPGVTVKNGKTTLKKGTDYTVSYKNNKSVGTASVTIKGKGYYAGTVTKTFKITPKKTSVKKLTSPKTKQLKVTYKKVKGVTGYQVTYSTSKKFAKSKTKTVTVKGNAKTSKTVKSLKKGKKYYVKVRTYKTVNGKKYYSAYSKVKTVKVK